MRPMTAISVRTAKCRMEYSLPRKQQSKRNDHRLAMNSIPLSSITTRVALKKIFKTSLELSPRKSLNISEICQRKNVSMLWRCVGRHLARTHQRNYK